MTEDSGAVIASQGRLAYDLELAAIAQIVDLLGALPNDAQHRIAQYVAARYPLNINLGPADGWGS